MTDDLPEKAQRVPKYWICMECAAKKQWAPPSWPVTITVGLCGWCDCEEETTLIPIVDFTGPGMKAIWD